MENRQRDGFDVSLPGSGLLIWHIDEQQSSNTDENHYKVALMQADGKRELERSANRGDAGDAFPGITNNRAFTATSTPNSKSYANANTFVAVTGIGPSGPSMTVQIQVSAAAAAAGVKKKPKAKTAKKKAAKKKKR